MPGRSLPNTEEVQQGILECPQLVQNPPRLSVALQVIPVRVPKRGRKQITWRHEGLIRNNYPFFSDKLQCESILLPLVLSNLTSQFQDVSLTHVFVNDKLRPLWSKRAKN